TIENSSSYHNKNLNFEDKYIPYITRTSFNNGMEDLVGHDKNFLINEKNAISLGAENANFFYQAYDYLTGNKMYRISFNKMNKGIGLFLVEIFKNSIKNTGYGYGLGLTGTRFKKRIIKLPVDINDEPDWEFMETETIRVLESKEKSLLEYIEIKIDKLEDILKGVPELNLENKDWVSFNLEDIFTIQRGKRLTKKNQKEGYIPYISSTGINNGVNNFISNNKNVRSFENVSTIANSGTVGSTFYHDYKFVASDHVTALINDNFNKYHYLFINTLLKVMSKKYHFNREMNDFRLSREKIMLPIDENNNLDLYFMENYMKKIELEKLKKIREYLLINLK